MKSFMKVDRDFIYPCLGIREEQYTDTNDDGRGSVQRNEIIIVLFSEENIGTIVYVEGWPNTKNSIGFYWKTWNMEMFELFHGEITIK